MKCSNGGSKTDYRPEAWNTHNGIFSQTEHITAEVVSILLYTCIEVISQWQKKKKKKTECHTNHCRHWFNGKPFFSPAHHYSEWGCRLMQTIWPWLKGKKNNAKLISSKTEYISLSPQTHVNALNHVKIAALGPGSKTNPFARQLLYQLNTNVYIYILLHSLTATFFCQPLIPKQILYAVLIGIKKNAVIFKTFSLTSISLNTAQRHEIYCSNWLTLLCFVNIHSYRFDACNYFKKNCNTGIITIVLHHRFFFINSQYLRAEELIVNSLKTINCSFFL